MPGLFLQNVKIVVVVDHSDVRLLIAEFLGKKGALVWATKNAFDGIGLIKGIGPDVVLSDINMPGRDGFELSGDIRALGGSSGGSVPVIAMTAFGHTVNREITLAAGFQAHPDKPFTPDQLLATIDSVLRQRLD